MNVIQGSIRYPVSTTVGVLLVTLFGFIALARIPVQLTPNVEEPKITVQTFWPGASPHEVEREIIEEQEEQLKSLEGLTKLESSSADSYGTITLTFPVGTDLDSALLRVSNRLQQVPSYPPEVEKPVITTSDVDASAIAWFMLAPLDAAEGRPFEGDIATQFDFADEVIKPEIERVPGVAVCNIYGGREREMHVVVDPAKLAARQVTINQLGAALDRENRNFSGGDFSEGKRRYVVRTVGDYASPEDIESLVVAVRGGVPIYLKDVAKAEMGYRKPFANVYAKGRQVLAINAVKSTGANVLQVMDALKTTVARLNRDVLHPRGLKLAQAYDETDYIHSAIDLVKSSLYVGAFLAVVVLLLFLRSVTSTLVIALSMPISLIATFIVMWAAGRTLNVISLAGMAFAVGMVVDNSIVVLENIYRHRQMGKPRYVAALEGTKEVWGAVLASTLTTVAVFIPVVFIKEEAGQLFGDIALALGVSVALSLVVSVTVIPSLSARLLHTVAGGEETPGWHGLWGGVRLANRANQWVRDTVSWLNASFARSLAVVVVFTAASLGLSWLMMPKTEYLPIGNQNFLFGIMLPPPGYSLEEVSSMQDLFKKELEPLWTPKGGSPEAVVLPGGGVEGFFFVTLNNLAFMGVRANDPLRVTELIPTFMQMNAKLPGTIAVVSQASIFQRGAGTGRNIDIELTGPELETLIGMGGEVFGKVSELMPGSQARPIPSLDLGNPEVHVVADRRRAAEMGISNRDLGFTVSALIDGAKATDYEFEGREIDLKVMAPPGALNSSTHLVEMLPIATPDGRLVTLGSVADVTVGSGPVEIAHRERQRSITIQVTPSEKMPVEEAMDIADTKILGPMRDDGRLSGLYQAHLSGTADKLAQTGRALYWNFLLACVITYLLMAALFESFLYPFVIMFSVPLAGLGGFLGLRLVNTFLVDQKLDVLTMLGFIILVGTVVNNAILIVHQSLNHMREEKMPSHEAIVEATGNRIRPIFMSVGTSVFGMLPLVLFPGAGSELYRGLGSVVVGGLTLSTVFTLFVVPAMFSLSLKARAAAGALVRGRLAAAGGTSGAE